MKMTSIILLWAMATAAWAGQPGDYNVVWDSPSADAHGSMPLGNGDISLNVWVEPSGALAFYIGKTDSWDDNGRLLKLGKVRVTLDPAPPMAPFRQELALEQGAINVRYGDGTTLRVWVDAQHPAVRVDVSGKHTATATIEPWRTAQVTLPSIEVSDVLNRDPRQTPTIVEPDTILTGQQNRIGWYHRNIKSVGPKMHAEIQGTADFPREDPLLHRTFGVLVTAPQGKRLDDTRLQSTEGFDLYVLTQHPATADAWLARAGQLASLRDFKAHQNWWSDFWQRSWMRATTNAKRPMTPVNGFPLLVGVDRRGGSKFTGEMRGVEAPKSVSEPFTLRAEVRLKADTTGRIFDKITPGQNDGFLLDVWPGGALRLIVGRVERTVQNALPVGEWAKVALIADHNGCRAVVNGKTAITITATDGGTDDAAYVSQMFALQRFITASAGRGEYPIKFNGSIFTVPYPDRPGDADYRRWGPGYWWQNTRLAYYSTCTNGDFDVNEALWHMYVDRLLALNKYRTRKYFGFDDAAYYIECIEFWGDAFPESYGWTPFAERKDPLQVGRWHKWEWVGGPELVWMMLEEYEHTQNEKLLAERIIPTADAVMRFFDNYYRTNEAGQLVMVPSQALETWWETTNPMPEIAGLRAITGRLLALPENATPAASRAFWKTFLAKLPPLPTHDTPSGKALAPAEKYARKSNIENPELYAVFPFRLCAFEKDNRQLGLRALEHREDRGMQGWRQDDIFMAYLGLTGPAQQALVGRAHNHDKGSRFPAFWGPNYDWIPDQCHGGVLMRTFQAMLMQTDGKQIFLLPAWPEDWDCEFKLHAPYQTTVEGKVVEGKLVGLKVTPEHRRNDVKIVSANRGQ